ncbi:MAG: type II toxin-antitoxin system RelE/ParE family toxin [Pseudooceanicola sp.]|nr:type II toxin-antitoxin system RelE/ParE family toxin [Pseudooceanicola sp.]
MTRVVFTPAAASDINAIWDYTAHTWGIDQAEAYLDAIRDACAQLASGSGAGRPVSARGGYFKLAVGRHFLFYRAKGQDLEIVRILHQRMDAERHF